MGTLSVTTAGCDTTEQEAPKSTANRDVYTSLDDCVADWGDQELCERQVKEGREHLEKMAAAKASSGSGGTFMPIFFGPTYHGSDRYYRDSRGDITQPTTQKARQTVGWNPQTRAITTMSRNTQPIFKGTPPASALATTGPSIRPAAARVSAPSTARVSAPAVRSGFGGSSVGSSGG